MYTGQFCFQSSPESVGSSRGLVVQGVLWATGVLHERTPLGLNPRFTQTISAFVYLSLFFLVGGGAAGNDYFAHVAQSWFSHLNQDRPSNGISPHPDTVSARQISSIAEC